MKSFGILVPHHGKIGDIHLDLIETSIIGCYVINQNEHRDKRGLFARKFCFENFQEVGLNTGWRQHNFSSNKNLGTIRGFHYQSSPFEEIKLVTCVRGKIFDAVIDLRPQSKTFLESFSIELTDDENKSLYIPKGVAHAYQTLESNSAIYYLVSEDYKREASRGLRYNDKVVSINFPLQCNEISPIDQSWPDFRID